MKSKMAKGILNLFHRKEDELVFDLNQFKEKLGTRFFLSDLNRKEFYIVLMSSINGFDAIMDDADLVHENKLDNLPNFSPLDQLRMHHLIWLGKAYWVSSSELHTDRLKSEIKKFLRNQHRKEWINSIDFKIAVINIITSILYFLKSPNLDNEFLINLISFLFKQGRMVKKALRNAHEPANYCAGLLVLLYIGLLFLDKKEGKKWVKDSFDALQEHILKAVLNDGTHSSHNIECHLLSTELLTTAYVLLKLNGYTISNSYTARLELMYEFIDSILDKTGKSHLLSTNHYGRLFKTTSGIEHGDLRDLMAAGASIFNRDDFRTTAQRYSDLALILLGTEGYEKFSALTPTEVRKSKIFKDGHYAFFKSEQIWASFDFGIQNDESTLSSGDSMNFAISGKNDFILNMAIDGDTPIEAIYSGAIILKEDEAKSHNPVIEDTSLIAATLESAEDIIEVERKLSTKNHKLFHQRRLSFDKVQRSFLIEDKLYGAGKHSIKMPIYFHPGLRLTRIGRNTLTLEGEEFAFLRVDNEFELIESDNGHLKFLVVKWSGHLPFKNAIFIYITGSLDDLNRIINARK